MAAPAFLFDLDGTLMDSVHHSAGLAERSPATDPACRCRASTGASASAWPARRRDAARDRAAGRPQTTPTAAPLPREAYAPGRPGAAAARRDRAARDSRSGRAVVDRHQRLDRERRTHDRYLEVPDGVPVVTHDQVAHAKPTPTCSSRRPNGSARHRGTSTSSATACGTCWPPAAPASATGLLSVRYFQESSPRAGAPRLSGPRRLLAHLDEVAVRSARAPERPGRAWATSRSDNRAERTPSHPRRAGRAGPPAGVAADQQEATSVASLASGAEHRRSCVHGEELRHARRDHLERGFSPTSEPTPASPTIAGQLCRNKNRPMPDRSPTSHADARHLRDEQGKRPPRL